MRGLRTILLGWLMVITAAAWPASKKRWVEIDLSPRLNGQADLIYKIRYSVSNFDLHGFYFQGTGAVLPVFKYDECRAVADDGRSFGLSIRRLADGRYDVVLANGAAFRNGEITYTLRYACDLARAGFLGRTQSQFGDLVYLNWAPVEWDTALEHMTVMVHYPIAVEGKEVAPELLQKVGFRTEPFMNQQYSIDYYGQPDDSGRYWLTVRVHAKSPGPQYHMQIKQYVSAQAFPLAAAAVSRPTPAATPRQATVPAESPFPQPSMTPRSPVTPQPWRPQPRTVSGTSPGFRRQPYSSFGPLWAILALGGVMIAVGVIVMALKHVSVARAADSVGNIRWERDDWVAPKLQVSTFRKTGKVAEDLDNVEAGVLLEVPFGEVLVVMFRDLARRGFVEIVSLDPVQLRPTHKPGDMTLYEQMLLTAIQPDESLSKTQAQKMFELAVENLQKKAWDCDLDATRAHYRQRAATVSQSLPEKPSDGYDEVVWRDRDPSFWYFYHWYLWDTEHDQARSHQDVALRAALDQQTDFAKVGYSEFVASEACHSACYAHDACHDACHSACHDACHSACHDACHSACHDACHSACVSGGDH